MAEGMFIDPKTKRLRAGHLIVLQRMGEQADGKIHFVAGQDTDVFHLEEGDRFYTAIFAVDPFSPDESPPAHP